MGNAEDDKRVTVTTTIHICCDYYEFMTGHGAWFEFFIKWMNLLSIAMEDLGRGMKKLFHYWSQTWSSRIVQFFLFGNSKNMCRDNIKTKHFTCSHSIEKHKGFFIRRSIFKYAILHVAFITK